MNLLFQSIYDDVVTVTNRPDLVNETTLAVKMALSYAHGLEFFPRDRVEVEISNPAQEFVVTVDIPSSLPLYRKLSYIRPFDVATGTPTNELITTITPDKIFDDYLLEKQSVCYIAGSNLHIKFRSPATGFIVGYFKNPQLNPNLCDSWIATEEKSILITFASSVVFRACGLLEDANAMMRLLKGDGRSASIESQFLAANLLEM